MASDDDSSGENGLRDLKAYRSPGNASNFTAGAGLGFDLDDLMGHAPPVASVSTSSRTIPRKKSRGMFSCLSSGEESELPEVADHSHSSDSMASTSTRSSSNAISFSLRSAYPLSSILNNPEARRFLKVYASKEYSLENILAWEMFQAFLNEPNAQKRVEAFFTICDTFFSPSSPQHVNIPHPSEVQLGELKASLEQPQSQTHALDRCEDLLAASKKTLEDTNMNDIYLRFTRSPDFDEMLRSTSLSPSD